METKDVRVPLDRLAVVIGKNGVVKRKLARLFHVQVVVDSEEGEVVLSGEDSLAVYEAAMVVKAIGRGFHPDVAFLLKNEAYSFDLVDVQDFVGRSKKHMDRIRGRVIGKEGKARKMIEQVTETFIVVYGKTIGIIGPVERVAVARHALEMLLEGAPHGNVYSWLDHKKRALIREELEGVR